MPWAVSDELWSQIEPLIPARQRPEGRPGRRSLDDRRVLSGILFVLITGVSWVYLPTDLGYGSGMTCWRRLRDWNEHGAWPRMREVLAAELPAADSIDWTRAEVEPSATVVRRRARISFDIVR